MAKVMVTCEAPAVSRDHTLLANTLQDSCIVGMLPAKWWGSNFCLHCLADCLAFSISAVQTAVAHIWIIGSRSCENATELLLFFKKMIKAHRKMSLSCSIFPFEFLFFYLKCFVNISVQNRRVQVQFYTHHYLGPRCCCVVFFPPIVFQHCFMWMTWWFAAAHFIRASLTDSVTKGASWLLLRCVKLTVFFLNYNCSAEPPFELAYESCVSPRALSAYL